MEDNADTANGELLPFFGSDTPEIQHFLNFRHGLAAVIPGEDFLHYQCHLRIGCQNTILPNNITNRRIAAVVFTFHSVVMLPPLYFLGKLSGIILCIAFQHGFQYDAFRTVRNIFLCGNDLNSVAFQYMLIVGTIISVSREAVQLPHDHDIKQPFFAVRDHLLECRPVSSSGG